MSLMSASATIGAMALVGLKPSVLLRRAADAAARWDGGHGSATDERPNRQTIETAWGRIKRDFEKARPKKHKTIYVIHEDDDLLEEEEATDVVDAIRATDKHFHLDVVLHTFGGRAMASERIAEAILARKRTTAFIPNYAMSGGTVIALATRKVVFGQHASLGPIDIQFGPVPAHDLEQLEAEVGIEHMDSDYALAAIRARGIIKKDVAKACELINPKHKSLAERWFHRCTLAQKLAGGGMDHSERIRYSEAVELGINATERRFPHRLYGLVMERRKQLKMLRTLDRELRIVTAHTPRTQGNPGPAH